HLHDGAEQLLLVLEVDVEGALGDAGRFGDVGHAGGVEPAGQEDLPCAIDNLAPLGAVFAGFSRAIQDGNCCGIHGVSPELWLAIWAFKASSPDSGWFRALLLIWPRLCEKAMTERFGHIDFR